MSSSRNHRRGHGRIQERGPRWENPNPAAGCNSTHVARSRKKWKACVRRAERRTGLAWGKFFGTRYKLPQLDNEDLASQPGIADEEHLVPDSLD